MLEPAVIMEKTYALQSNYRECKEIVKEYNRLRYIQQEQGIDLNLSPEQMEQLRSETENANRIINEYEYHYEVAQ